MTPFLYAWAVEIKPRNVQVSTVSPETRFFSGSGCKLCRPVPLSIDCVSTLNSAHVILKEIRNCRECSLFSSYVAVTLGVLELFLYSGLRNI